jgi:hypothetical protein
MPTIVWQNALAWPAALSFRHFCTNSSAFLLRQTIGAYPINVFVKAFNLHKKTPLVWVSTSLPSSLFGRKKQKTGEESGDKSTTYQHLPHPPPPSRLTSI